MSVLGLAQAASAASSSLHWNVDPASEEVKLNDGSLSLVVEPGAGPAVIVVSGAVASTIQVRVAGEASGLPAPSIACTVKVCWPSGTSVRVRGLVQAANAALSSLHWNVDPSSEEVKLKEGSLSLVVEPGAGPAVIVVSGAVVSTGRTGATGGGATGSTGDVTVIAGPALQLFASLDSLTASFPSAQASRR